MNQKLSQFVARRQAQVPAPVPAAKAAEINLGRMEGVVLPEKPVFDKIVALFLFLVFGLRKGMEEVAALDVQRQTEGVPKGELGLSFWGGARVYRGKVPQGTRFAAGGNRPTKAQHERWERDRVYPIDVGRNKYQERGTASAAECVAWDLGLIQKWGLERLFRSSHEWIEGTERAKRRARSGKVWDDKNQAEADAHAVVDERVSDARERVALHYVLYASANNGTGYLKERPHSIVYLLRELQKPDVLSADDADRGWTQWTVPGVIRWVLDILVADFQVRVAIAEGRMPDIIGNREARRTAAAFLNADEQLGRFFGHKEAAGDQFAEFNFASYLRNLVALGTPTETVVTIADNVIDTVLSQTFEQRQKARECLALCDKDTFGGGLGVVLMSADKAIADNPRVVREMWRLNPVVRVAIVINSREQVSILSDGTVPLGDAAAALQKREPNRWFYDPRIGAILNGGHSFTKVPATQVPLAQIRALIEEVILEER